MFCDLVFECVLNDENVFHVTSAPARCMLTKISVPLVGRGKGGIAGVSALLSPREARGEYEDDAEGCGGGGTPLTVDGEFLANSRHAAPGDRIAV